MGGGGNQKTTQKQKTKQKQKTGPYKPTQAPLTAITNAAAAIPSATNTTPTPLQTGAIQGLQNTASNIAQNVNPQQEALVNNLYQGGGLGQGAPALQQSYQQASQAYQPYLDPNYAQNAGNPLATQANNQYLNQNYLDPNTNPYLSSSLNALQNQVQNNVGDQFALAGRSFSGDMSGALGKGYAQALAPLLLGQYNQNVGAQQNAIGMGQGQYNQNVNAQQNAAQGLLSGANQYASGIDATGLNRLNAQMAAAGQTQPLYNPYQQQLSAAQQAAGLPYTNLNAASQFLLPIAGAGSTMNSQGTMTGTTTQPVQGTSPLQTAAGLSLGTLGLLGGTGGFGPTGWLTNAFGS